jgi:hypothetical protein
MKSRTARVETEFITDPFEPVSNADRTARTRLRTQVGSSSSSSVTKLVLLSRLANSASAITRGRKINTGDNSRTIVNLQPQRA